MFSHSSNSRKSPFSSYANMTVYHPFIKYRYAKYNTFSNKFLSYFHIIPIHTRSHASSESEKIARGFDCAELFIDELLTELINDGTDYHWLPTFLTETNKTYKTLYDFLTDILDIEVIRPENLRNNFNDKQ